MWVYNQDAERMVFLARIPIVFLTLGLGLIGYHFARELWGRVAALVALIFLLFDPNILAHGRYSTTDIGGAAMVLLSALLLWRLWVVERFHWRRLAWAGLGLGLALGSKLSNLLFIPIFGLLAMLPLYGSGWHWRSVLRRLIQYGLVFGLSLVVVWALYAFEWGPYRFLKPAFVELNRVSGPLPTFAAGIEQILGVSSGGRPSYLLGQFSIDGWWYYFPVAFAAKTPVLVLVLFLVAAFLLLFRRKTRAKTAYLLIPPAAFFLASMQSALNIGYRHLLPILPFLYVMASGIVVIPRVIGRPAGVKDYFAKAALLGALLSVLLIDLFLHPHYLSYFNILAGGPANGHKILVDSNIDWGQDLIRLRSWMDENEIEQVNLSWFGTADPGYYGIKYQPLPGLTRHFDLWWNPPFDTTEPEPGVYAISVSNLWELPLAEKTVFPWFRAREPDDRIGYSINIYVVEDHGQAN
jgi:4-amino-4-deoxy-L-arabinose transferase-like glycosyltransferase